MQPNPEIRQLLQWYIEAGVDEAIASSPTDWFGESVRDALPAPAEVTSIHQASPPAATPHTAPQPSPPQTDMSAEIAAIMPPTAPRAPSNMAPSGSLADAIKDARERANKADSLEALRTAIDGFEGCSIKKTAKQTVFADGVADSGVMCIGEAPGADEDRQGVPFCGASGQLLEQMLNAIELKREENYYISNAVFWRPPGNRQPTTEEIELCRPFVEKHIALVKPKLLILIGGTAAKGVLNQSRGITQLRGKSFTYSNEYLDDEIQARVLFHPSYLLRQPLQKKLAWADLLEIKAFLKSL